MQFVVRKEMIEMNVYEVGSLAEKLSTNVYPGLGAVGSNAQHDATTGINIGRKLLSKRTYFINIHIAFPFLQCAADLFHCSG